MYWCKFSWRVIRLSITHYIMHYSYLYTPCITDSIYVYNLHLCALCHTFFTIFVHHVLYIFVLDTMLFIFYTCCHYICTPCSLQILYMLSLYLYIMLSSYLCLTSCFLHICSLHNSKLHCAFSIFVCSKLFSPYFLYTPSMLSSYLYIYSPISFHISTLQYALYICTPFC